MRIDENEMVVEVQMFLKDGMMVEEMLPNKCTTAQQEGKNLQSAFYDIVLSCADSL